MSVHPGTADMPVPAPKSAARKRIKGASREVWGILNPYGDIWTTDTFESPEKAVEYVAAFWRDFPSSGVDLRRFKPVKVRVRVTAITPRKKADGPKGQDGQLRDEPE